MKKVYLFTGEEKYLLDQELKRWMANFVQKFGSESVFFFSNQNFDTSKALEVIFGWWLFSDKKLIVISGLPHDTDSDNKLWSSQISDFCDVFMDRANQIPDNVLLLFVSHKPDKRLKFYKFLQSFVEIKTFKNLSWVQYNLFIKDQLDDVLMSDDVIDYFLMKVWKDLFRIVSEIDKLKYYLVLNNISKIDQKIIDFVVYGQMEVNSFLFFDYFLKDKSKSIVVLDDMHKEWVDFNQALGMLYRGLKLYLYILDLHWQGVHDSKTLASITKQHPFAIWKNLKQIKILKEKKLNIKKFYCELLELDYNIKTWKLPSTLFWLILKWLVYEF